jgi:hypothetical protein
MMEESAASPARLSLWVPCSRNRGGLPVPQLYAHRRFSAFDSLQSFCAHDWHLDVLQDPEKAIDPTEFCYLLSASLWRTNYRYIDGEIKQIAFKDLRTPSISVNNRLHDLRRDLHTLKDETFLTRTWMPDEIAKWQSAQIDGAMPLGMLSEVIDDSQALERFLMDTFQLLMSSISVLDSQASILDARRSARLTQLATIW